MKEPISNNHRSNHFLRSVDLIGSKFQLSFKSSTGTFQTKLGGFITILLGIVSLGILAHILSQYLDTESPIVTTSTELNAWNHTFNLYKDDLYLPLALSNAFGFIKDFERFITPKLRVYKMVFNSSSETYGLNTIQEFDYKLCSSINDKKILNIVNLTHSNQALQKYSLCPDFEGKEDEFSISDDHKSNIYRRIELALYLCSLENPAHCAKENEFLLLRLFYGKMNKLMTSANYNNPVTPAPSVEDIRLNPHSTKSMKFAVHSNKIIDNKYEFIAPTVKAEYSNFEAIERDLNPRNPSQLHCTRAQIGLWVRGGCLEFLNIVYEVKREIMIVRRNYKRITVFLGEFGGIMKLLSTVMFFLYSWYNKKEIRAFLADALYGYNKNTESFYRKFLEFGPDQRMEDEGVGGQNQLECLSFGDKKPSEVVVKEESGYHDLKKKIKGPGAIRLVKIQSEKVKKRMKSRARRLIEDQIKSRIRAPDLISKLSFVEFLEDLLLDQNTKALFPLAVLKAKQIQQNCKDGLKKQEKEPKQQKDIDSGEDLVSASPKKLDIEEAQSNTNPPRNQDLVLKQGISIPNERPLAAQINNIRIRSSCSIVEKCQKGKVEEVQTRRIEFQNKKKDEDSLDPLIFAYKNLVKTKPEYALKVKIKDYILNNISNYFENEIKYTKTTQKHKKKNQGLLKNFLKVPQETKLHIPQNKQRVQVQGHRIRQDPIPTKLKKNRFSYKRGRFVKNHRKKKKINKLSKRKRLQNVGNCISLDLVEGQSSQRGRLKSQDDLIDKEQKSG